MTCKMDSTSNLHDEGLTIINNSLLRASGEDWKTPELILKRIRGRAAAILIRAAEFAQDSSSYNMRRSLLMFDCMLRVINEPALTSPLAMSTRRFQELQLLFYGALCSTKFCALSETARIGQARAFYTLLSKSNELQPLALHDYKPSSYKPLPAEFAIAFDSVHLNE